MEKPQRLVRRPQTHRLLSEMVNKYWQEISTVHEDGKLLAFCTYFPFFEMMEAMDIRMVQDENYGAYLMARRVANEAIAKFDAEYDSDLCSYMKACNAMLFYHDFEAAPMSRIPKPDFEVCLPACDNQLKEAQEFERRLNIPTFWFDIPQAFEETKDELEENIEYVRRQVYDYVEFLEDMTHRPYNWDKLKLCLANTKRNSQMWQEGVTMARLIPSPITWFDSILNIFAVNMMQGRPEPQAYFEKFNAEIRERAAQGIGAIQNEKYRLLWDFNVMFSKLSFLSELFARNNANVVIGPWVQSPHRRRWWLLNPEEPVSSLVYDILTIYPAHHRKWAVNEIRKEVAEYAIDGIVLHSPRTCKMLSCGMLVSGEELREFTELPVLNFEGDTGDENLWNDAVIETRIEAFMEEVATSKEQRLRQRTVHTI